MVHQLVCVFTLDPLQEATWLVGFKHGASCIPAVPVDLCLNIQTQRRYDLKVCLCLEACYEGQLISTNKRQRNIMSSPSCIFLSNVTWCVFKNTPKKDPFRIKITHSPVIPSLPAPLHLQRSISLSAVMDVARASDWKGNRLLSLSISQQSGAVDRRSLTQPCEAVMSLSNNLPRASKAQSEHTNSSRTESLSGLQTSRGTLRLGFWKLCFSFRCAVM